MTLQKRANIVARLSGYGTATKIVYGLGPARVLGHVRYGYRKNTTDEYVSSAYRNNFGWKNTYYQPAETTVLLPIIFG